MGFQYWLAKAIAFVEAFNRAHNVFTLPVDSDCEVSLTVVNILPRY